MSFFWPGKLNPSPNALVYLGRALHWMGCATALAACLFGIFYVCNSVNLLVVARKPTGATLTMGLGIVSIGVGVAVFFLSRALRYAFSRE